MTTATLPQNITNDITTRLLAQENLLIQRAPVSTASFDVLSRVLTLPQWQNMTPEIEEMLKAHEVAHALFTDFDEFERVKEAEGRHGLAHAYLNILEDARIEKLMKRKFPGLRSVFTKGYTQLNERDFFDLKKHKIDDLLLIDRINLYFKAGFNCGVKFSPAEKHLVDQVARLESINEVVLLARKIYEFSKKQRQQQLQNMMNDSEYRKMMSERAEEETDDDEDYFDGASSYDADEDLYDDEENRHEYSADSFEEKEANKDEEASATVQLEENKPAETTQETADTFDSNPPPVTMKSFEEKLAEMADVNTRYTYVDVPLIGKYSDDIIIPYKTVLAKNKNAVTERLEQLSQGHNQYYYERYAATAKKLGGEYDKFFAETNRVVTYLVKEFEMKKAATDYKRVQVAKTGILDSRKLAQFKIREDLFKSIAITKDGKKHGMLFVLDWSGSMSDCLVETVKQLISLVSFCHRVKIPFQVFAFSDNSGLRRKGGEHGDMLAHARMSAAHHDVAMQFPKTLGLHMGFSMIELFSHRMTNSEVQQMYKTLFNMAHGFVHEDYCLGGTPLNEALIFAYDYAQKFVTANQVEKFTLIKLTDGDGGYVYNYTERFIGSDGVNTYAARNINRNYEYEGSKRIKCVTIVRDSITKKVYATDSNTQWGNLLSQIIKDRYNCGIIGFHVTQRRSRDINYAMNTYGLETNDAIVYEVRRDMIKENFAPLKVFGHDELFLLSADIKVSEESLDEDMTKMTASSIAKKFGKYLTTKKTSRVLLNRFVGVVA